MAEGSLSVEISARNKFRLRVLTPIVVLVVLSSLDRVNISFAALQMNAELSLTAEAYGFAVGVFFAGYLLFQFPSTALLTRIGARRWIATCVGVWGTVAALMAFSQTALQLYCLRFLLGAAEAGFAPGIVIYVSAWMPHRYRANTIAITMLAIPISVVIGGPLCGWLMSVAQPFAASGWRFMMVIEGLLTIAMAGLALVIFSDRPQEARWLNAAEIEWIERERGNDAQSVMRQRALDGGLVGLLVEPTLWLCAGVWCTTLIGANGMIFWLPQVIKEVSSQTDLNVGILTSIPWLGVGLGMVLNSWHSDKTQERFKHVGIALLVAASALYLASIMEPNAGALSLLFVAGAGLGSAQGVFWSIPTQSLAPHAAAIGITFINLIGNVGSLVGPYAIGAIRTQTESFAAPILFVVGVLISGIILLMLLYGRRDASR